MHGVCVYVEQVLGTRVTLEVMLLICARIVSYSDLTARARLENGAKPLKTRYL